MVITYSKGNNQPGKVANPARGQLNREIFLSMSPFAPENIICMYGKTYRASKSMHQPGKVANLPFGQLNRVNEFLRVRIRA